MYVRAVVLLDGSQTSEVILKFVPAVVCSLGLSDVILLRAFQGGDGGDSQETGAGSLYLKERMERLQQEWPSDACTMPKLSTHVISGGGRDVAGAVSAYVADSRADLMMISTYGWSGSDWWSSGGTDERVIKESRVPVFVYRIAGGRHKWPRTFRKAVVGLDGSALAESVLDTVRHLSKQAGTGLTLVHCVQPGQSSSRHVQPPFASGKDAESYLANVVAGLQEAGVEASTSIRRGHPGQQIADAANDERADLVVV
ncbi:MAG: universal stress protein, partial [SAR202 cluster bacterium]|nr:universal stress protein [SAR202 cluster bacterium]